MKLRTPPGPLQAPRLDRRPPATEDDDMFPPPRPWQQIADVVPEREYVAFTSRFFLRSPLRLPAFMAQGQKIAKQVTEARGIVGWSLGANLPTLEFYTLS